MSCCLSLVSGDCLLAALLSRGEHTCSFYVSPFYLILGTAPTSSLSGSLYYMQHFDLCSHSSIGTFLCMRAHDTAQGTDLRTGLLLVCIEYVLDAKFKLICSFLLTRCFDALLPSKKNNDVVDSLGFSIQQRTGCSLRKFRLHLACNPWGYRTTLRKSSW